MLKIQNIINSKVPSECICNFFCLPLLIFHINSMTGTTQWQGCNKNSNNENREVVFIKLEIKNHQRYNVVWKEIEFPKRLKNTFSLKVCFENALWTWRKKYHPIVVISKSLHTFDSFYPFGFRLYIIYTMNCCQRKAGLIHVFVIGVEITRANNGRK